MTRGTRNRPKGALARARPFPRSGAFPSAFAGALLGAMLAAFPGAAAATSRPLEPSSTITMDAAGYRRLVADMRTLPLPQARATRDAMVARAGLAGDELAVVDALLAARADDTDSAERALRALLDAHPERRLVRFELVRVLMAARRYTAARFQLRRLVASETDGALLAAYRAIDRDISRARPWDVSLSVSAAPRANANRGSTETEALEGSGFVIDPQSRARAAVSLDYGGSASYRFLLSPRTSVVARLFAGGQEFERDASSAADLSNTYAGIGAFVRHELVAPDRTGFGSRAGLDVGLDLTRQWGGGNAITGNAVADLVTPHATLRGGLSGPWSASLRQSVTHVAFRNRRGTDGLRLSTRLGLTRATRADRSLTLFAGYDGDRAARGFQTFDAGHAGASFYAEGPLSFTFDGSAKVGARRFRDDYPILGAPREDVFWRIEGGVTKRDWAIAGFAPRAAAFYERQTSNVGLATFDDAGVSLGFSRGF